MGRDDDLDPASQSGSVVTLPGVLRGTLLLAAGFVGASYWIASVLTTPTDPVLLRLLYRYGDSDYLPLTFALARGQRSEFLYYEGVHSLPLSFPWVSQLLHAALVWTMGPWGFAVADVIVCAAFLALWLMVARRLVPSCWHQQTLLASVLFFLSGPLDAGTERLLGHNLPFWSVTSSYWEFRYPRPFVTSLLTLAAVLALVRARERWSPVWMGNIARFFIGGVLVGLLLQGDLHGAFALALLAGVVLTFGALERVGLKAVTGGAAAFTCGVLVVAAPFLMQASISSAELRRRWGEFPVSRLTPLFFSPIPTLALFTVLAAILWHVATSTPRTHPRHGLPLALLTLCAAACAFIALPLFGMLTGRQIQQYHFILRGEAHLRLAWLLVGYIGARHVGTRLGLTRAIRHGVSAPRRRSAQLAALACVWVAGGGMVLPMAVRAATTPTQPESKVAEGWPAKDTYHRDLAALLRELAKPEYDSRAVLGTFDQPLSMTWATSPAHYLYVPDVFLSTASDALVLARTASLAKCLGATHDWFSRQLDDMYFQTRFISLVGWQASTGYMAAPVGAYTASQLARIARSRTIDSWHIETPPAERARQLMVFDQAHACVPGRLDVVVHARVGPFAELPGTVPGFVKQFENTTFSVWTKPTPWPPGSRGER